MIDNNSKLKWENNNNNNQNKSENKKHNKKQSKCKEKKIVSYCLQTRRIKASTKTIEMKDLDRDKEEKLLRMLDKESLL